MDNHLSIQTQRYLYKQGIEIGKRWGTNPLDKEFSEEEFQQARARNFRPKGIRILEEDVLQLENLKK